MTAEWTERRGLRRMAVASLPLDDLRLIRRSLSDARMQVDEDLDLTRATNLDEWIDLITDVIEEQP